MELVILVGPPGSGKTSFAMARPKNVVRISQDDDGKQGHYINFLRALADGKDIIIDRMNHTRAQRDKYRIPAFFRGYTIKIILFETPREECMLRMAKREGHPTVKTIQDAQQAMDRFEKEYEKPGLPYNCEETKYIYAKF